MPEHAVKACLEHTFSCVFFLEDFCSTSFSSFGSFISIIFTPRFSSFSMHCFLSLRVCPSTTPSLEQPFCTALHACRLQCKSAHLSTCMRPNEGVSLLICRGPQQFVGDPTPSGAEPTRSLGNPLDRQLLLQAKCLLHFQLENC